MEFVYMKTGIQLHPPANSEERVSVVKYNSDSNISSLFVGWFSWRYNPLCLYFHSPVAGFSLIVFEVS